jgi:hypothetical protein
MLCLFRYIYSIFAIHVVVVFLVVFLVWMGSFHGALLHFYILPLFFEARKSSVAGAAASAIYFNLSYIFLWDR